MKSVCMLWERWNRKYERKFYKVGEGRATITEDKVSDENVRLLTMAAIAPRLGNMKGDSGGNSSETQSKHLEIIRQALI